jgi:hypothetical protein
MRSATERHRAVLRAPRMALKRERARNHHDYLMRGAFVKGGNQTRFAISQINIGALFRFDGNDLRCKTTILMSNFFK